MAALTVAMSLGASAQGQQQFNESQVKAAFLFNFMKFIEWPSAGSQSRPLTICIAGAEDVREALETILAGSGDKRRTYAVRALHAGDDPRVCDSVFIPSSEARSTADILAGVQGAPILTVGEAPSFLREGGMIRLYVRGSRLRFQIDPAGAATARLKVSAQLLSLGVE